MESELVITGQYRCMACNFRWEEDILVASSQREAMQCPACRNIDVANLCTGTVPHRIKQ